MFLSSGWNNHSEWARVATDACSVHGTEQNPAAIWIAARPRVRTCLHGLCLAGLAGLAAFGLLPGSCATDQDPAPQHPATRREDRIPEGAVKRTPAEDAHPPILHSAEWLPPQPLPAPISTAGAEDSPFVLPDGRTLYFWFTPDVSLPPQEQLFDDGSGIWTTERGDHGWTEPRRV